MAVKASCSVTLSCYRDTKSVTRYYKLQSSTSSAPSKPSSNPPSGWDDAEPSYTSGSTNTLYFCDLTVFSDGTWSYSTVSRSSSYEAAKEAYNKAQNAQNAVDDLDIGGRNLVLSSFLNLGNNTKEFTLSAWASILINTENILSIFEPSTTYVLSYDGEIVGLTDYTYVYDLSCGFLLYSQTTPSANRLLWCPGLMNANNVIGDKGHAVKLFTTPSELPSDYRMLAYTRRWTSEANGSGTAGFDTVKFTNFKLEVGNKATDWTPAPEDVDENLSSAIDGVNESIEDTNNRISDAESLIAKLEDVIAMLVTDGNGTSLMTQTADGWTFNVDSLQKSVSDTSNSLNNLVNEVGDINGVINVLKNAVRDFGELSEYVKIMIYEDEPCIKLGENDSDFKLLITNTRIMFMEGSNTPTYINTKGLVTKNIEVEEELMQGGFVWRIHGNGNLGLIWKGADS